MYVKCKVCQNDIAEAFAHDHHERPQAAGGGPADEAKLCAGCHANVHAIANMLASKTRAGLAEDAVKQHYKDPEAQRRAFKLATLVVEWMRMRNEGLVDPDPNKEVRMVLHLPMKAKLALKALAQDRRHTSGRSVGLESYARAILLDHVFQRYPNLKNEMTR
jgi:hypothetical protein